MTHRMSLRVCGETKTMLKAVVVTEHRGLNLDARGWAAQAEDVTIVMVHPNPFEWIFSKLISPQDRRIPLNGNKRVPESPRSNQAGR